MIAVVFIGVLDDGSFRLAADISHNSSKWKTFRFDNVLI